MENFQMVISDFIGEEVATTVQENFSAVREIAAKLNALNDKTFVRLAHLTKEEQNIMCQQHITFQGMRMQLSDLETTWPSMRAEMDVPMLTTVAQGDAVIGMAPPYSICEVYIPRTVMHSSALNPSVLSKLPSTDHLVISGFPRTLFEQFVDIDTDQRWTILSFANESNPAEDEASFRGICESKKEENVHWIQCYWKAESDKKWSSYNLLLRWMCTKGSDTAIAPFVRPASDVRSSAPLCSHTTEEVQDVAAWNNKVRLLVGQPGTGKTQFLRHLATEASEQAPVHWVVLVDVLKHVRFLSALPAEDINMGHLVELLAEAAGITAPTSNCAGASRRCLEAALFRSGAIDVFIDAIDEICPVFQDKLIQLIGLLLTTQVNRVWISSRPEVEGYLCQVLHTLPYTLRPFSKSEQKEYLCSFWRSKRNAVSSEIELLADGIVENLLVTDDLLEVPLYLQMTAEIFRNDSEIALNSSINIYYLYQCFIQKKKRDFFKKFENCPFIDSFDDVHQNCAMFLLASERAFGDIDPKPFKDYLEANNIWMQGLFGGTISKEKTDILCMVEDGNPTFLHRNFAEYFAARWMISNINYKTEIKSAVSNILLGGRSGNTLRYTLEHMLAEGHPLHKAVLEDDEQALKKALVICDLNDTDCIGRLALHVVATCNSTSVVDCLLSAGSDIARKDSLLGWSALRYASATHHWVVAEKLLKAGADCNDMYLEDFEASSVLKVAELGLVNVMKWLISTKFFRIQNSDLEFLGEQETDSFGYEEYKETPTHVAACYGQHEVVKLLLENGANINEQNFLGRTPLLCAAGGGSEETVLILLQFGANVSICDVDKKISLHVTAWGGYHRILKLLLKQGADANARNSRGVTPLMFAADRGNEECIILLLLHGADISICDENERTAMDYATSSDNYQIMRNCFWKIVLRQKNILLTHLDH